MPSCTQNSTAALFADDSKCFRLFNSINDCLLFQKDIDSLYNWGQCGTFITTHPNVKLFMLPEKEMLLSLNYCMNDTVLCM